MNANELADAVEGAGDNSFNDQASTMLRQQAKEIAELKKIVEDTIGQAFYEDDYHKAKAEIEVLKLYKEKIETMERAYDNHFAQAMGNPEIKKASEK
jgi:hypothetical protein